MSIKITLSRPSFQVKLDNLLFSSVELLILLDQLLNKHFSIGFPNDITSKSALNLESTHIEVNLALN